jgi:hypothetical protein
MEPSQSTISNRIGLLLSICTFGLLAPVLISFRKEQIFDEYKRINEMTVNQSEEEKKVLKPRNINRYVF